MTSSIGSSTSRTPPSRWGAAAGDCPEPARATPSRPPSATRRVPTPASVRTTPTSIPSGRTAPISAISTAGWSSSTLPTWRIRRWWRAGITIRLITGSPTPWCRFSIATFISSATSACAWRAATGPSSCGSSMDGTRPTRCRSRPARCRLSKPFSAAAAATAPTTFTKTCRSRTRGSPTASCSGPSSMVGCAPLTRPTRTTRKRSPISSPHHPSARRPGRSRSTTCSSTSAPSFIPSTAMSEGSTRLKWTSDVGPGAPFAGKEPLPFGRRRKRPRGPRLPVVVVTGFLGSGKTTLIRALLDKPEGAGTAVVVNEYGDIGIDHALLRSSSDLTVLLGNGCLCCNVRSDLQETLRELFPARARGAVPSFERVVIETSGLADPGPVLQTFATDRALGREFHLQALICVIDAVTGMANLEQMPEARRQAALADRVVVSKSDLAEPGATERLVAQIAALHPAPVDIARRGKIEPTFLLDEPPAPRRSFELGDGGHSHGLTSFSLLFDEPLSWPAFEQAMAVLAALRGSDLLRVKGLVAVAECRGPVVVHFVQHVAHPPIELEDWPDEDRRSRLVFLTRGLARAAVEQLFAGVAAVAAVETAPRG